MAGFPDQQAGALDLTEGGQETELMYKHGHELPEFAMYPLLDDASAVADLTDMYTRYLEVAAAHGFVALMGGLDYRASPDWASKSGSRPTDSRSTSSAPSRSCATWRRPSRDGSTGSCSPASSARAATPTATTTRSPPRRPRSIDGVQIATLTRAGVDLVSAMTFNNVPEAVGVARAAASAGLPLSLSFMVDASGRLTTGPTLKEAVEAVDEQAGDARPDFYGINCSHPVEFQPALLPGRWIERVRSLRPNASGADKQAPCQIGHLEAGDPQALGAQLGALSRRLPHIDVWGGCCGTWDDHLRATAQQLRPLETAA